MIIDIFIIVEGRIVARRMPCPFCSLLIDIPRDRSADEAYHYLVTFHLPEHAEEMTTDVTAEVPHTCPRCKRVPLSGATPHRACYLADCDCPCSYPADLTPRFEEAE